MTQTKRKSLPSFKMLLGILVILLVGGYSLAWVVGGPLLYIEGRIEEVALVTTPNEDVGEDGELFFALSYNACRGVKEHIVLGNKDMDKKTVPKRLKRIRECLMGLTPGSTVPVVIDTRAHRITGSKTWRIRGVGDCSLPHLPSRLSVQPPAKGETAARCSFM